MGACPRRQTATSGLVPPPDGYHRATARDRPGPSTGRRRPSAASRSLVGVGAVPAPHRCEPGPGVRRVPRRCVPRWALPPLQRRAGYTEPRPAAVPGADAPPVPDHRQHPLPKGRRGSGGLVHRGHGGRVPATSKPLGFTVRPAPPGGTTTDGTRCSAHLWTSKR